MPSIEYETIYKRALRRIDDLNLASYTEEDFYDTMRDWLQTETAQLISDILGEKLFRKQFSEFTLDDELMTLAFTLTNSVDDSFDTEFVTSLLAKGIIINYMPSKIDTDKNLAVMIGSDKEKKLIGNYNKNMERLQQLERDYSREIARHGYYFGDYGNSNG